MPLGINLVMTPIFFLNVYFSPHTLPSDFCCVLKFFIVGVHELNEIISGTLLRISILYCLVRTSISFCQKDKD